MSKKKANDFRWKHGNSSLPHKLPKHLVVYTLDETVRLMDEYAIEYSKTVIKKLEKSVKELNIIPTDKNEILISISDFDKLIKLAI
jgi:hypothetical protein